MDCLISLSKLRQQKNIDLYQLERYLVFLDAEIKEKNKAKAVDDIYAEILEKLVTNYSRMQIRYMIEHDIKPFQKGRLLYDLEKEYGFTEKQIRVKLNTIGMDFRYFYDENDCEFIAENLRNLSRKNKADLRDEKYIKDGWIPLRWVFEEFGNKYDFSVNTGMSMLKYLNIDIYKPLHQLSFINNEQKEKLEKFLQSFKSAKERRLFFQKETVRQKYGEDIENPAQATSIKSKISVNVKDSCTSERQKKIEETKLLRYGKRSTTDTSKSIQSRIENGTLTNKVIYIYDDLLFSSSWELYFYIYHKEIKYNDIQKGKIFSYFYNGKEHFYECDFLVNGENIEIKGNQYINTDGSLKFPYVNQTKVDFVEKQNQWNQKFKCMKDNNVRIISKAEIEPIIRTVQERYTKDYVGLFRKDLEFPYPKNSLKNDYELIQYFHRSVYQASRKGKVSPLQAWEDKSLVKKSALNRLKYIGSCRPSDVLQGFNVAKIAPKVSVFKPMLAQNLIEKYLKGVSVIYDPFSGFSGRLLGAFNNNISYHGKDINKDHVNESNKIIHYKKMGENYSIQTENILEAPVRDYSNEQSALFTCPPYGGKEHWNENNDEIEKSCDEWIDICLVKYKCRKYLFVVDTTEKYKDYIINTIENKSHFGSNMEFVILIDNS